MNEQDIVIPQRYLLDDELDRIFEHAPKDPSGNFVASAAVRKQWVKSNSGESNNKEDTEEEGSVKRRPIEDDW